jgi:cyclohexa-1,5-dienecarbonyl-CoA hydratase
LVAPTALSALAGDGPIRVEEVDEGQIWRVWLDAPKANVIDSAMIAALTSVFEAARDAGALKAIVLEGEGRHFSFGASVEEHLPDRVGDMLPGFHRMFGAMLDASVPVLAAVRGQCLGGGLELVAFCNRVFSRPSARFPRGAGGSSRPPAPPRDRPPRTGSSDMVRTSPWAASLPRK